MFEISSPTLDALIKQYKHAPTKLNVELATAVEGALTYVDKMTVSAFSGGGPGWASISPAWRRWKARNFFSTKILIMTGLLLGSITHRRFSRFAGRVYLRNGTYPPLKSHFVAGSKMRKRFMKLKRPVRTVAQVGYWHETGQGQSAKRDFFERTAKWCEPQVIRLFSSAIRNSVR